MGELLSFEMKPHKKSIKTAKEVSMFGRAKDKLRALMFDREGWRIMDGTMQMMSRRCGSGAFGTIGNSNGECGAFAFGSRMTTKNRQRKVQQLWLGWGDGEAAEEGSTAEGEEAGVEGAGCGRDVFFG